MKDEKSVVLWENNTVKRKLLSSGEFHFGDSLELCEMGMNPSKVSLKTKHWKIQNSSMAGASFGDHLQSVSYCHSSWMSAPTKDHKQ